MALVAARAHLALGDGAAAQQCLRPSVLADESAMPLVAQVAVLLASAGAAALLAEDGRAVEAIVRACQLAAGRTTQPFVDVQEVLADVLARHPEAREAWPLPVVSPAPRPEGATVFQLAIPSRLAEALTERELTVLRRLASTMTAQDIAVELCVSVNTVKTHIAAIYRKLPARGRHDAVARARQLELL